MLPLRNCWRSFCRPDVRCGFIVLAELADEKTVADMIQAGAWDGAEKSLLNGADLLRTIWCALHLHAIEPKRNLAEDSVRKLSCAVPQSADTIMTANSEGIIEYVNATCESLTGYSSEEAGGPDSEHPDFGPATPALYREWITKQWTWKTTFSKRHLG